MRKLLIALFIFATGTAIAQPANYTRVAGRYRWTSGFFDSTLHLPSGSTPRLGGGFAGPGALFYKTTDSLVYLWTGYQWKGLSIAPNTLYNANDSLTSNRTVSTSSGKTLTFQPATTFTKNIVVNNVSVGAGNFQDVSNTNVAVGFGSMTSNTGGAFNTSIGMNAQTSLLTGSRNTALGTYSLNNATASAENVAVGDEAGRYVTGSQNTILGSQAWKGSAGNSTGIRNIVIGWGALPNTTSGSNNIAMGPAMGSNTTGSLNVAIGGESLAQNTTSSGSVAVGYAALTASTGTNNIAIGSVSGKSITSGSNNTLLGSGGNSMPGITTGSYNTIIGSQISGLAGTLANHIILADGQGNMRLAIDGSGNGVFGGGSAFPTIGTFKFQVKGTARVDSTMTAQTYYTSYGLNTQSMNYLVPGITPQKADRGILIANGGSVSFNDSSAVSLGIGNNVIVGNGVGSIAIGYGSNARGGGLAIGGGYGGATSTGGIAIGSGTYTGNGGIAIAGNTAGTGVAIGGTVTGAQGIAIGTTVANYGNYGIVIGDRSRTYNSNTIVLGLFGKSTGNNQFIAGSNDGLGNGYIADVYFGSGVQRDSVNNGSGSPYTINGSGGLGTNYLGGDISIAGGKATGNEIGGDIFFRTSVAGSSGTALQSLTERVKVYGTTGDVRILNRLGFGTLGQVTFTACTPFTTGGTIPDGIYYYYTVAPKDTLGNVGNTNNGTFAIISGGGGNGSINVTWNALANATSYRIYRRVGGGGAVEYFDTYSTSFLDINQTGTAYNFGLPVSNTDAYAVKSYISDNRLYSPASQTFKFSGNYIHDGKLTFDGSELFMLQNLQQTAYNGAIVIAQNLAKSSGYPIGNIIMNTRSAFTNLAGGGNTVIGASAGNSLTTGSSNVMIGSVAGQNVTNAGTGTYIGSQSVGSLTNTNYQIQITAGDQSFTEGVASDMYPTNQSYAFIGGGSYNNNQIKHFYFGAAPLLREPFYPDANKDVFFYAPSASQVTNKSGGNFTINAGRGTGTGTPGDIIFATSTPTTTGTDLQTLTNRVWIKGDNGNVGIGASPATAYKLDVQGQGRFTNILNLDSNLVFSNVNGSQKQIFYNSQGIKIFHNYNALGNNIVIGWSGETISNDASTQRSTIIGFHNRGNIPSASQIFGSSNNFTGYTGTLPILIFGNSLQLDASSEGVGYTVGSSGLVRGAFSGIGASDLGNGELPPAGTAGSTIIGTGVNNQTLSNPNIYLGQWGSDDGMPTAARNVFVSTTNGVGTNVEGYNLVFSSGRSTGNATSKDIIFATPTPGSTGTALQTLTQRWWVKGNTGTFTNTSTPDASAIFSVVSTTKGVLLPRMTTTEINAIASPAAGLIVYNTTLQELCFYDGTTWRKFSHSTM